MKHENIRKLNNAGMYLIRLLFSVLHSKEIPSLPQTLDWETIYEMAKKHSVEVMAFYGAEASIKNNSSLYARWKKSKDINMLQNLLQKEQAEELFRSLGQANIRFMPLKGFEIKSLYTPQEFRQMADIDILIDPSNALRTREIMENLGYQTVSFGIMHHDEYFKAPYVMVEIHRQLLLPGDSNQLYYDTIWEKAVPISGLPNGWKLIPEDFYIYQIVHFHKHYNIAGSGIRSLLDIYVFLDKFREMLDRSYIEQELRKLGLYDFCIEMEELSHYWFSEFNKSTDFSSKKLEELQLDIFLSGVFGSREFSKTKYMKKNRIEKGFKNYLSYFWKRIFFSRKELEYLYPALKKRPYLLPVCEIHRLVDAVLHKKDSIRKEWELFRLHSRKKKKP